MIHRPPAQPLSTRLLSAVIFVLSLGTGPSTWASTPQEKVLCSNAPRSQWLSEAKARDLFEASRYVLVKYKVSKGNCHEFYAVDAQGTVVETYMHPVTGEIIRSTRIPADAPPAPRTQISR
jgi:hypothetical protein